MNLLIQGLFRSRCRIPLLLSSLILFSLAACKSDKKEERSLEPASQETTTIPNPFIDIVTEEMDFQMVDTIKSGWNLFRYNNKSPQTHFFMIDKYPEGKTVDTILAKVAPYFDEGMRLINEGNPEGGFAEFAKLPAWFSEVQFLGGSGLVSPGLTTTNQLYLEPGDYIMECYVKMSNGVFHTSMGMVKTFHVEEAASGTKELKADINISISSEEGIVIQDSITSGNHVFLVQFKDQIVHENFVGHDVNLVKLEEDLEVATLASWMDWSNPQGLIEPAPKGISFIGGVNNMPGGGKGYFSALLEPGRYAWVSEVPNPQTKNMLIEFRVE